LCAQLTHDLFAIAKFLLLFQLVVLCIAVDMQLNPGNLANRFKMSFYWTVLAVAARCLRNSTVYMSHAAVLLEYLLKLNLMQENVFIF